MRIPGRLLTCCLSLGLIGSSATSAQEPPARSEIRLQALGAKKASLAAAAQGRIVVLAWLSSESNATWLRVAVSGDGGRTFGQSKRFGSADSIPVVTKPAVVVLPLPSGPKGLARPRIIAAWAAARQGQSGIVQAFSDDSGQSFKESFLRPEGLPAKAAVSALTFGPAGQLHALWMADSLLLYARAEGQAFSAIRRLDASASRCGVSAVAVGADNAVSVMWYRSFAKNDEEFGYVRSRDGGVRFGSVVRASHERWGFKLCPGASPSLSVDAKGAVRFVFQALLAGDPPRSSFFTDRSPDGRTFRPRVSVEVSGFADARSPQLLPERGGGLSLVWDGLRNDRRYVMIRHSLGAPGGAGGLAADWMRPGPPIVLDQTGRGAEPVVAPVPDGVLAAWLTGSPDKLSLAARRFGIDELCGLPSTNR